VKRIAFWKAPQVSRFSRDTICDVSGFEQVLRLEVECARKQLQATRKANPATAHMRAWRELLVAIEKLHWYLITGTVPECLD
jgi:hypothetical protein